VRRSRGAPEQNQQVRKLQPAKLRDADKSRVARFRAWFSGRIEGPRTGRTTPRRGLDAPSVRR
jgi:hypothetical protein